MYRNLLAEMIRNGVTRKDISEKIKRNLSNVGAKINYKSRFTLDEAYIIRDELFPHLTMEYLFEKIEIAEKEVANE